MRVPPARLPGTIAGMDVNRLKTEAQRLLAGQIDPATFLAQLGMAGDDEADETGATLDMDRQRRCGFPEVVFAEGKPVDSLLTIVQRLREGRSAVLTTRVDKQQGAALVERFAGDAIYNETARTVRVASTSAPALPRRSGDVCVVTAGTSDLPVAEEAAETLVWMGVQPQRIHDVGVAGPHRVLANVQRLREADAIVVAAGMEGALPSVIAGHVACPVFAVPTSVGYGASFGGLAALLGMLNSCAANVAVVNIDAGFKAGYLAGLVATRVHRTTKAT
jgi:NCAIR mutase (PurE)-related protein